MGKFSAASTYIHDLTQLNSNDFRGVISFASVEYTNSININVNKTTIFSYPVGCTAHVFCQPATVQILLIKTRVFSCDAGWEENYTFKLADNKIQATRFILQQCIMEKQCWPLRKKNIISHLPRSNLSSSNIYIIQLVSISAEQKMADKKREIIVSELKRNVWLSTKRKIHNNDTAASMQMILQTFHSKWLVSCKSQPAIR